MLYSRIAALHARLQPRLVGSLARRRQAQLHRGATYERLALLADRYAGAASAPALSDLTAAELSVFSQNGEDGVLCEILRRVGTSNSWFVEFGVESGIEGNCVFLAEVLGWQGLFMDGGTLYPDLERRWAARPEVRTRRAMVTRENVDELLDAAGVPEEPDVVSIDVDGNDLYLWEAMRRRPRVLIIEYNGSLSPTPDVRLAQPYSTRPWDGTDRFGASLGALEAVSARKGYVLVYSELAGVNAFFVRRELADGLPAGDAVRRRASNIFLSGHAHRRSRRPGGFVTID